MRDSVDNLPILIHGILPRSGTNYLNKLILSEKSCEQPKSRIRENWYLHHSALLFEYFDELFKLWSKPEWKGEEFSKEEFQRVIGDCLLDFLSSQLSSEERRLVTKTPSVQNIGNIDLLFPKAKNVIIVRNPLDVAASTFNSWNVPVDVTLTKWNEGCNAIYEYETKKNSNYYLLRYEDLINDLPRSFRPCIEFLGIEPSSYDWSSIKDMPVYGSSDSGSTWEISQKSESFKALNKWKDLPENQLNLLQEFYSADHASYFGYTGVEEANLITPLPDLLTRMKIGASKLTKPHDVDLLKTNETHKNRIGDLKEGVKLILNSIRP